MILRRIPAASDALLAIRASVGPIFPPTPRITMSPSSAANACIVASAGSLRSSSNSSTSRIDVFWFSAAMYSRFPGDRTLSDEELSDQDLSGLIVLEHPECRQHRLCWSFWNAGQGDVRAPTVIASSGPFAISLRSCRLMHLRVMTKADICAAQRLKEIAGWNQTKTDWERFLEASEAGCFVADLDGQVCGTATTIAFENRFAWVGMVLVDPAYRSRGIGTRLLDKTIEYLDALHIPCLKLDA